MPHLAALALAAALAFPSTPAHAASTTPTSTTSTTAPATVSETPIPVAASTIPPAGRVLSADRVLAIAEGLPKMKAVRAKYPGSYGGAYLKGPLRWQVSFFSKHGAKEIGQVIVADSSGRVLEQWTGFQVAWSMARGYPGAFGRHVNALYIWLPLCLLFLLPFIDPRRPFSLLHLDLLVLLSFSVSLAFFNHAHIYASVPLAYPPLVYLLGRMLWLLRRPRPGRGRAQRPLRLLVPVPWLALGVMFLLGFRIALNVTDANVIDVGYAGVIGADKIVHGRALYGNWPQDNEHGDTYGPVSYESYIPFEQAFGWSGTWDDLPAAHAAAVFFDLLASADLPARPAHPRADARRRAGLRVGGVPVHAVRAGVQFKRHTRGRLHPRGAARRRLAARAGGVRRARRAHQVARRSRSCRCWRRMDCSPAAGARWTTPGMRPPGMRPQRTDVGVPRKRARALTAFFAAFILTAAIVSIPALTHDSLRTIFERTIEYQANRGSPFSVWGLYGWHGAEKAMEIAAVGLAVALAFVPRRADLIGVAAACAAI